MSVLSAGSFTPSQVFSRMSLPTVSHLAFTHPFAARLLKHLLTNSL